MSRYNLLSNCLALLLLLAAVAHAGPKQSNSCTVDGCATCKGKTCTSCIGGKSLCGNACVDLQNDKANCGICGAYCSSSGTPMKCASGVCTPDCPPGKQACASQCVDLSTNTANCGTCGNACSDPHGVMSCISGQCTVTSCDDGYIPLEGHCGRECVYDTARLTIAPEANRFICTSPTDAGCFGTNSPISGKVVFNDPLRPGYSPKSFIIQFPVAESCFPVYYAHLNSFNGQIVASYQDPTVVVAGTGSGVAGSACKCTACKPVNMVPTTLVSVDEYNRGGPNTLFITGASSPFAAALVSFTEGGTVTVSSC